MKTTDYKKGDVVALVDGVHYKYLGFNRKLRSYLYEPIEPQVISIFCTLTDEACEKFKLNKGTVPFTCKMDDNVTIIKKGRMKKLIDWWKASNRWKHFLFAIPLGAVCGAPFTTGVGLGMEVKDHLYGGKADFVDFALTAVGGAIGHGAMLLIGLDYLIMTLINLIF